MLINTARKRNLMGSTLEGIDTKEKMISTARGITTAPRATTKPGQIIRSSTTTTREETGSLAILTSFPRRLPVIVIIDSRQRKQGNSSSRLQVDEGSLDEKGQLSLTQSLEILSIQKD